MIRLKLQPRREGHVPDSISEKPLPDEPQGNRLSARWLQLCQGAEQLEDAVIRSAESGSSPLAAAVSFLEGVLEDFPAPEDPSREFQAFAVHKLAHSIYEAVVAGGSMIQDSSGS